MRRIMSLILVVIMLYGMSPVNAYAAESTVSTETIDATEVTETVADLDTTAHTYDNGICTDCGDALSGLVITRQPVSDDATIGEKATVFVEAEGVGLSYQWYYRDSPTGALRTSTVTKSTYTLTVTEKNAQRELYCVITDAYGKQVTTDVIKLLQPPTEELKIITQPVPDDAVVGEKATVFVVAEGVGLSYQWYYRDSPDGVMFP